MSKQKASSSSSSPASYIKLVATIVVVIASMWFYNKTNSDSPKSNNNDTPKKPKKERVQEKENTSKPTRNNNSSDEDEPKSKPNKGRVTLPEYALDKAFPFPKPYPNATEGRQIVEHTAFTLSYYEKHEQAEWVSYTLTDKDLRGSADREHESFSADEAIERGSASPQDYLGTGYDRGHLAPAADMKRSEKAMQESFLMSNMSPQKPKCNRGIWRIIEEQVRDWAKQEKYLFVSTGPVLQDGLKKIGRTTKISVPAYYYKIILKVSEDEDPKAIAFLVKNDGSDEDPKTFVVSIDEVEERTGIDFYPLLPDAIEKKLEAANNPDLWEWSEPRR